MASPTALIFGVSGQTGGYLARFLLSKGYTVHGVSRDSDANEFHNLRRLGIRDKVTCHSASLTDFHNALALLRHVAPDEIYNLAGQSSVALSFDRPVETFESVTLGTMNILECVRASEKPVRLFQATSTDCFGNAPQPANEETAFRPQSPYAVAKAASHWAVAGYRTSYGLHACNGILSNHESPLRPSRFVVRKIIRGAIDIAEGRQDKIRLGNLSVERDWGWAPEYADAIWRILRHDQPGDYIIATGVTCSLAALAERAFAAVGLEMSDHIESDNSLFRAGEIPRVALDPGKAARELGWKAQTRMPELVDLLIKCERENLTGLP